ncbi:GAF domain-containing protein [candidate division KSB1 bacterium]
MKSDVKQLEMLLEREKNAKLICAELNNFVELKPTLILIIDKIKSMVKCQAISIRLHDDGDYPYYTYDGFPESFIKHENSLCSKGRDGNRIPSPDGCGYLLDCMCGNIINSNFDPSYSFFTKKGSFWSNHTTKLLSETTEDDRQSRTRNYCNSCGYESVALIPIKNKNENIGLIQMNDKRTGLLTLDLIEYIEMIGEQIGLAIHNSQTYEKLKNALNEINTLRDLIPICASCKKIRNDDGFWEQVEVYFGKHSGSEFSHGICPDCMETAMEQVDNMENTKKPR